jgi:hypothetical protein
MKALKEPIQEKYGMCYIPRFTEEFKNLIDTAHDKISPLSKKLKSYYTVYFEAKGEHLSSEYDCCDNEKCIKSTKKDIRNHLGKGTHVNEVFYQNDGDHERIEICCQCGTPLNEWLTWCEIELDYLEENKPWTLEFLKDNSFEIKSILQSSPTNDNDISLYHRNKGGDILKEALESREAFFQRIKQLAQFVNDNLQRK